ncbi:MAG: hypothetical protein P8074_09755 [Anaerolineales bacterium]|jgi:hypothetical protein
MKEQEKSESPTTIEGIREQLLDQVGNAEFGSATFQAFSDYFALDHQRYLLDIEQNNSLSASNNEKRRLYWESETRIRETQIALLEREIERNNSRVPGYARVRVGIESALDHLSELARVDAAKKYPNDEKMRSAQSEETFDNIYDEINDLIYRRQDQS